MSERDDIDHILKGWPLDAGEVNARLIKTADGREVVQMRIEMGLLQLETDHRPDGTRPGGAETFYDYLVALSIREGDEFELTEEQCGEADREFIQFYHRRICWLRLREYDRAVRDADHSLAFMDFLKGCSPNEEWTRSHEQYRPFILFHRTQAAALAALDETGAEAAIEAIDEGLKRLAELLDDEENAEIYSDDEILDRLNQLKVAIREHFGIDRTLGEQLADAIAKEEYELAARLRDEMAKRRN